MNRTKLALVLSMLICSVALFVQTSRVDAAPAESKDEAELRATDMAWAEAAARKDLDAVVSYMADDGETLPPNELAQTTKATISAGWGSMLKLPDFKIQWTPTRVQVAKAGDIGYTRGTWTVSFTGPDGKTVNDHGKYLEVWKKVDGKWKCTADMYNSDVPAK